eukprot:7192201-Prymnesium_polylepis.1
MQTRTPQSSHQCRVSRPMATQALPDGRARHHPREGSSCNISGRSDPAPWRVGHAVALRATT